MLVATFALLCTSFQNCGGGFQAANSSGASGLSSTEPLPVEPAVPEPVTTEPAAATVHKLIWDNDSEYDCFALTFAMVLANNNLLNLVGISQSPDPYKSTSENYQVFVDDARKSGWHNARGTDFPDASDNMGDYFMTALQRPSSGNINDTIALVTEGSTMIKDKVLSLGTTTDPIYIGTGGALTTVASAYLLAQKEGRGAEFIAKSKVFAGIGADGSLTLNSYNDRQDEWALYIVVKRLNVQIVEDDSVNHYNEASDVWNFIDSLPKGYSAIGDQMKYVKNVTMPANYVSGMIGDAEALYTILFPTPGTYFDNIESVSFDSWGPWVNKRVNLKAYQQIVNLKTVQYSNATRSYGYSHQTGINSFVMEQLHKAFGI